MKIDTEDRKLMWPGSCTPKKLSSSGRLRATLLFLVCFSVTVASPSYAQLKIAPAIPTKDGVDGFTFYFKDGTNLFVGVDVKKNWSKTDKAIAIQSEIDAAAVKKGFPVVINVDSSSNVNLDGKMATATTKFTPVTGVFHSSSSGEYGDLFNTDKNGKVKTVAGLQLQPASPGLAGIDSNGDPASYTLGYEITSLSFGNISFSTSLSFSDLITPTLDGLLQQQYDALRAQLVAQAPTLAKDFGLNLTTDEIRFQPADITTNFSVTQGTTDTALVSTLFFSTVPEPTTLALMGLGLAGIGYRRHRSKIAA